MAAVPSSDSSVCRRRFPRVFFFFSNQYPFGSNFQANPARASRGGCPSLVVVVVVVVDDGTARNVERLRYFRAAQLLPAVLSETDISEGDEMMMDDLSLDPADSLDLMPVRPCDDTDGCGSTGEKGPTAPPAEDGMIPQGEICEPLEESGLNKPPPPPPSFDTDRSERNVTAHGRKKDDCPLVAVVVL